MRISVHRCPHLLGLHIFIMMCLYRSFGVGRGRQAWDQVFDSAVVKGFLWFDLSSTMSETNYLTPPPTLRPPQARGCGDGRAGAAAAVLL